MTLRKTQMFAQNVYSVHLNLYTEKDVNFKL